MRQVINLLEEFFYEPALGRARFRLFDLIKTSLAVSVTVPNEEGLSVKDLPIYVPSLSQPSLDGLMSAAGRSKYPPP